MDRRSFLVAAALGPMAAAWGSRADVAPAAASGVEVIGRSAWGARPVRDGLRRHSLERITLHHSGVRLTDNTLGPARVRQHQQWHLSIGHPDIDYHYLIDRRGNIYQGRDARFRGDTQTEYDPTGHLLICCEGDYQTQRPPAAMMTSVARLMAAAADRWGLDPSTIAGHRNYSDQTACPGSRLQQIVRDDRLTERVEALLARGDASMRTLPAAEGRARVLRIESGG